MTTPLVSFAAGGSLTAAQMNEIQPAQAIKPTDQSVTSSTTLVNDNALSAALSFANASYTFALILIYEGGTLGSSDLKLGWTFPASTTMQYAVNGQNTSGAANFTASNQASNPLLGTAGASNRLGAVIQGTINVSSTTGTLQLQWAQHSSSATATIVHAGSSLALSRVS